MLSLVGYGDYHRSRTCQGGKAVLVDTRLPLGPLSKFLIMLPGEYTGLHPPQAPEPPVRGHYPVDEEVLKLSARLQLISQAFAQLSQGFLVFSRQEDLLRAETMLQGVEADGGLPLRRFRAGALQGVPSVG